MAWLGDLGGHLPIEPGVLDLCAAALARREAGGFRVEPIVPDFDFEALWQAFVTLRHATSGAALKVHYDNPQQRALLKPEAVWEIEGALGLTAPEIHDASIVRSRWYKAVLELFDRYDLLALPSAQVFAFAAETHWPGEIAGRKMDSYHRWMEVTALATHGRLPGGERAGRLRSARQVDGDAADRPAARRRRSAERCCRLRTGAAASTAARSALRVYFSSSSRSR